MFLSRSIAPFLAIPVLLSACANAATPILPSQTPSAIPASPTASVSPSPLPPAATPTMAPAPRTFTEGFDAAAPYWQFLQSGASGEAVLSTVQASTLRVQLAGPDQWAYALYAGQQYEDVRIDAIVDFGSAAGSSAGLICRYDPSLGWYEFDIFPDGSYSILFGQWLADGIARYTPLVVSESDQIDPATNEIGLLCQGNILTPYVNSIQLRRRQETQHVLTAGQIGISAASSEAGGAVLSLEQVSAGPP